MNTFESNVLWNEGKNWGQIYRQLSLKIDFFHWFLKFFFAMIFLWRKDSKKLCKKKKSKRSMKLAMIFVHQTIFFSYLSFWCSKKRENKKLRIFSPLFFQETISFNMFCRLSFENFNSLFSDSIWFCWNFSNTNESTAMIPVQVLFFIIERICFRISNADKIIDELENSLRKN